MASNSTSNKVNVRFKIQQSFGDFNSEWMKIIQKIKFNEGDDKYVNYYILIVFCVKFSLVLNCQPESRIVKFGMISGFSAQNLVEN